MDRENRWTDKLVFLEGSVFLSPWQVSCQSETSAFKSELWTGFWWEGVCVGGGAAVLFLNCTVASQWGTTGSLYPQLCSQCGGKSCATGWLMGTGWMGDCRWEAPLPWFSHGEKCPLALFFTQSLTDSFELVALALSAFRRRVLSSAGLTVQLHEKMYGEDLGLVHPQGKWKENLSIYNFAKQPRCFQINN